MSAFTKLDGPLTRENAEAALAKAEENGFAPEEVRVIDGYFLIPDEDGTISATGVSLTDSDDAVTEVEFPEGEPSTQWNNKQLDAYAKTAGVEFDSGVSTKADKVAALAAAKN